MYPSENYGVPIPRYIGKETTSPDKDKINSQWGICLKTNSKTSHLVGENMDEKFERTLGISPLLILTL